jgi:uncharacterized protein YciI
MMDSKSMTPEERAAEVQRIRSTMILQDYYIMHRRPVAPERKADVMLEHFQWLVRLEKEGHILVTGGIFMRDGTQSEGLTILRAADWDAAEALAASDPLILAGANSYHIERFRLGAGRITVSVDFSHQSMRLG